MTQVVLADGRTFNTDDRFRKDQTEQEVFDQVVYHLGTMEKRSVGLSRINTTVCKYRSVDGCACAIGYIISDDDYSPFIEGALASSGLILHMLPDSIQDNVMFIDTLQKAHDTSQVWDNNRKLMRQYIETRIRCYSDVELTIMDHPDMAWNK